MLIMLRIQAGEEKALGRFWNDTPTFASALDWKVLRDRQEAEELVQDVFFPVYRSPAR